MGASTSRTVGTNITNTMVAQIFTNVGLSCSNEATSEQNISVFCNPQLDMSVPLEDRQPYENQATCKNCIANLVLAQTDYYNLQRESWKSGIKIAVNLPIDVDYTTVLQKMIACGTQCKACVFQNLSQSTIIKNVLSCQSMLTITNTIDQKLTNSIDQTLTNNQDFLAPLAQMLGGSSRQQIIANLTNRISTKITNDVVAGVLNTIDNNQSMVLSGDSTAAKAQTQQSAFNSIVSYFQNTNLFSTIFTDEQWDTLQSLYNDQNTIGDLGNAVVKTLNSITKFVQSAVGKVVIAMIILVCIVFLGVLILGLSILIRKKVAENKIKELKVIETAKSSIY
jgi:hypothetical protein